MMMMIGGDDDCDGRLSTTAATEPPGLSAAMSTVTIPINGTHLYIFWNILILEFWISWNRQKDSYIQPRIKCVREVCRN